MNQAIIFGNIGRDAEMRYLQSGVAVVSFSVAVSERWNDAQTGEKREKTTWFRVSAWGKLGETLNPYLKKGTQVLVTGTIGSSAYTGADGEAKASIEIRATSIRLAGGRGDAGAGNTDATDAEVGVDDIPF